MRTPHLAAIFVLVCGLVAGCGEPPAPARPALRLVQLPWTESIAVNHVVRAVLEARGQPVEVVKVEDATAAFDAVAGGRADAFLNAWLPLTHAKHLARYGPELADYGTLYEGARIGLVTLASAPVESLEEISRHREKLGRKIIGLDMDSGLLDATRRAIEAYDLGLELVEGETQEIDAAIEAAHASGGMVLFPGWRPHRRFQRWALKFLADPKGVFSEAEDIRVVAARDLDDRLPEAGRLLHGLDFDTPSFEELLTTVHSKRAETERHVKAWILAHGPLVESWTEAPAGPTR